IDYRAMLLIAWPLFANSSLQAVLNLTDTWFVGRISAEAVAAIGAVHWLALAVILLLAGVGFAVQTLVAQSYGAGRFRRAAHVAWTGVWAAALTVPLFVAVAWAGPWLVQAFGLTPAITAHAIDYWQPRLLGGAISVALWALLSFFSGIGRTRVTLSINAVVALCNPFLNELLMFRLGLGVAGAAWATSAAMVVGVAFGITLFLHDGCRRRFATDRTWRPRWRRLGALFALGIPMGLSIAFDLIAFALFQVMQVRLGPVPGAATQIVTMLTSVAFMPAVGLGMAGTTLVGQSIGAGHPDWAQRLGNATIRLCAFYMVAIGVLVALLGPLLMPLFVGAHDPDARAVVELGVTLLWIAACYQFFDGLNLGAGFALRGAGDAKVPALILLLLSWGLFVPLVHVLTFAPGQGWIEALPALGWGATGGWAAAVVYVWLQGLLLTLRWRSRRWQSIRLR
ncbi:MAG: MATE family efflux transporter, partial [Burkholderiales bacterium]